MTDPRETPPLVISTAAIQEHADISALLHLISEAAKNLHSKIAFCGGPVEPVLGDLTTAEAALSRNFHPKRLAEFRAGRVYARRAMAAMGEPGHELLIAASRAPVWPANLVGSISHGGAVCGAIVAPARSIRALGFDVDADTPLPERLASRICTPDEFTWLAAYPCDRRLKMAKTIFCMKESFYKAYATVTAGFLGFQDARVRINEGKGTFEAQVISPDFAPLLAHGRYGDAGGHMFSLCLAD
jgi:4'-phosphopantetheinyl transferase EntD